MHTNQYIVDTSALINLLFGDIVSLSPEELTLNKDVEEKLKKQVLLVPDFVITELYTVFQRVIIKRYKLKEDEVEFYSEAIKIFFEKNIGKAITVISAESSKFEMYISSYKMKKNGISFTDYLLECLGKEYNCEVLTLDKKLKSKF